LFDAAEFTVRGKASFLDAHASANIFVDE